MRILKAYGVVKSPFPCSLDGEKARPLMSSGSPTGSCSLPPAPWLRPPLGAGLDAALWSPEMPGYRRLCPDLPAYSQTDSHRTGQTCFLLSRLEPCMG